jgi:4-amino-4-deoxychorismate lyase
MDNTILSNYSKNSLPLLKNIISIPSHLREGTIRCRIDYNNNDYSAIYESYIPKKADSLRIIFDNTITYDFKYTDRDDLTKLMDNRLNCDEILIIKHGLITDTSYSNIIFFNGKEYHTPKIPLLKGTCRTRLLKEGKILEKDITVDDLSKYAYFKLINSMLNDDLTDLKPVSAITIE